MRQPPSTERRILLSSRRRRLLSNRRMWDVKFLEEMYDIEFFFFFAIMNLVSSGFNTIVFTI
jgi:hypothetical protein